MLIWPWEDRNRRFSWLKASAFALMLLPAIRTAYLVGAGDYGSALTVVLEGLTYWSGVWATVILLMALAVTPAATIFRWPAVIDVRRMIGVSALVYTIAHMVIYFAFRHWDFAYIVNDMTTRVTLIVATASTVGLIVLGATSVDAAVRYMGARNWQRLHTTNYVISEENLRLYPPDGSGLYSDLNYRGRHLQLQFTVEDQGVFTMPWTATITYGRPLGVWREIVCAENPRKYGTEKDAAVPTADRPDF
jgi:DMSO/TMAO reductase YedYZ heme-binding membrane subunit